MNEHLFNPFYRNTFYFYRATTVNFNLLGFTMKQDITNMFKLSTMPALEGLTEIYQHYSATQGRYPGEFMQKQVNYTKQRLFIWWAAHRLEVAKALELYEKQTTPYNH